MNDAEKFKKDLNKFISEYPGASIQIKDGIVYVSMPDGSIVDFTEPLVLKEAG